MIVELSLSAIPKVDRYKDFNLMVHHVVDLFHDCLGTYSCGKFRKIAIRYFNFEPKNQCSSAMDVLIVNIKRPIDDFFELDVERRKYWVAGAMYEALHIANKKYNMGHLVIENAYSTMLARGINRIGRIGTVKTMKNGMRAQVCFQHTEEHFDIFVRVCNDHGVWIRDVPLVRPKPYHLEYSKFLGKVTHSHNTLVLTTIDGKQDYRCLIEE